MTTDLGLTRLDLRIAERLTWMFGIISFNSSREELHNVVYVSMVCILINVSHNSRKSLLFMINFSSRLMRPQLDLFKNPTNNYSIRIALLYELS